MRTANDGLWAARRCAVRDRAFFVRPVSLGQAHFRLGVGPQPIPQREFSAVRLAVALTIATSDVSFDTYAFIQVFGHVNRCQKQSSDLLTHLQVLCRHNLGTAPMFAELPH